MCETNDKEFKDAIKHVIAAFIKLLDSIFKK